MDYKIVLDAGHGGNDPGAVGNGIIEKDLTLEITKYLYDRFNELGIPVKVTRLEDITLTPTERVNKVLNSFGNSKNVIVLSNHINAGGGDGAEIIYPLRNTSTLPDLILNEIAKEGQNIRKSYQRRSTSNPSKDYYFMQRNTGNTEALTIEYGFLDSSKDDVNQLKNNYKDYAEAVVRAVTSYINADYYPVLNTNTYIVKKGDTLYSISKKFNTTVDELKRINNLITNALSIGQQLVIPSETIESIEQYNTYIVKKGDTLYSIANKYNTTIDKLKEINNLSSNILSINQQLLIPSGIIVEEVTPTKEYIVKKGDTLYSIAKNNNLTVDEIKAKNNLNSNLLSLGQKLYL